MISKNLFFLENWTEKTFVFFLKILFFNCQQVVGREFTASHRDQQREHWYENKDQLYSHGKKWGEVQPGTLDNIYSTCLQSLNVSTGSHHAEYHLVFEVDAGNHGLLKSCGNYPKGCQDDCFSGVSIHDLKPYRQSQPSRNAVLTKSTTNNPTTIEKVETATNYGNRIVYSNFLLLLNIFIIKTIVCTFY